MHGLFLGQGWAAPCCTAAGQCCRGPSEAPPHRGSGHGAQGRTARRGSVAQPLQGWWHCSRDLWHSPCRGGGTAPGTCGTALHRGGGTAWECQRTPGLMLPPARHQGPDAALDTSSSNLWLNVMGCSIGPHDYTEMSSAARFAGCPPRPVHASRHISHGCPLIYLPGGCSRPRRRCCTAGWLCRQPPLPCPSCTKQSSRGSPRSGHWGGASRCACRCTHKVQLRHQHSTTRAGSCHTFSKQGWRRGPRVSLVHPSTSPAVVPERSQALQHCGVRQRTGRHPSSTPAGQPWRCPSCKHCTAPHTSLS